MLAFKHLMIIILISLDLRAILNNISAIKYYFVFGFPIGHDDKKVKDKQILLNSLKCTSLESYFI